MKILIGKDLTLLMQILKLNLVKKLISFSLPVYCSSIWDRLQFLHHLTLNLSSRTKKVFSQTIYTDEPLWKTKIWFLQKSQNQIVEGILEFKLYPIILHYKEGNGVVPFEKK